MKQLRRRRFRAVSVSALLAGVIAILRLAAACQDNDSQVSNGGDGGGTDSSTDAEGGTESDSTVPPGCVQDGAPGTLDPSFGDGGIVLLEYAGNDNGSGTGTNGVRLQADGKVVVAWTTTLGDTELARLLPNGSLDPAFGTNGHVETHVDAGPSWPYTALDIQPDGKIVAAAGYQDLYVVMRHLQDGRLDPSFGDGGVVEAHFASRPRVLRVVDNGHILVSLVPAGGSSVALSRFNADGTVDPTFGDGGAAMVPSDIGGNYGSSGAMAVLDGGSIVVGGTAGSFHVLAFFRYTATGQLDTSYGDGGAVAVDDGRSTPGIANAIAVDSEGRILLGGGGTGTFRITRATATGALDRTFASNGTALVDFGGDAGDGVVAMNVEPDGKIVAAGTSVAGASEMAVARLVPNGTVDTSFGVDGKQVVSLAPSYDLSATALAEGCRLTLVGPAVETVPPRARKLGVLQLNR